MKRAILAILCLSLVGCSTMRPKKTEFYKDGKLIKTYIGRGVFDSDDWFGTYKIWTMKSWTYYEYNCSNCEIVETVIQK